MYRNIECVAKSGHSDSSLKRSGSIELLHGNNFSFRPGGDGCIRVKKLQGIKATLGQEESK